MREAASQATESVSQTSPVGGRNQTAAARAAAAARLQNRDDFSMDGRYSVFGNQVGKAAGRDVHAELGLADVAVGVVEAGVVAGVFPHHHVHAQEGVVGQGEAVLPDRIGDEEAGQHRVGHGAEVVEGAAAALGRGSQGQAGHVGAGLEAGLLDDEIAFDGGDLVGGSQAGRHVDHGRDRAGEEDCQGRGRGQAGLRAHAPPAANRGWRSVPPCAAPGRPAAPRCGPRPGPPGRCATAAPPRHPPGRGGLLQI